MKKQVAEFLYKLADKLDSPEYFQFRVNLIVPKNVDAAEMIKHDSYRMSLGNTSKLEFTSNRNISVGGGDELEIVGYIHSINAQYKRGEK